MVQRTKEYLALHANDPVKFPASVRAVAAFVPCSHSLFSKADPQIQQIVHAIDEAALAAADRAAVALTAPPSDGPDMSDGGLQLDIEQCIKRTMHVMAKYIGRRKEDDGAATAALAKYDLDEAMICLRREQDRLQVLLTEWDRRARLRQSEHSVAPQDLNPVELTLGL